MWFLYVVVSIIVAAVSYLSWFCFQLLKQNGRVLARVLSLEKQILDNTAVVRSATPLLQDEEDDAYELPHASPGSKHPSLAVGDAAPDFTLPDLTGAARHFSEWRGRPILLIFSSASCGFCTEMGSDLAAIDYLHSGSPMPVVVTNGPARDNQEWVDEYGLRFPVLLQDKMEIANRYLATGTPMGYLIDKDGRIASEIAVGSGSLLALSDMSRQSTDGSSSDGSDGRHGGKGSKPLAESRILRDGLPAGANAPDFTLPTLDGREISLDAYRGSKVLLVFSDPQCGPCLALEEILEQRHRARPDVNILMVSRGSTEANQEMVAERGLTFPLVLQRKWEISKAFGMFATPIAYLVDQNGIIENRVAVGADEILSTLSSLERAEQKEVVSGRN